jgi:hypothetical protein
MLEAKSHSAVIVNEAQELSGIITVGDLRQIILLQPEEVNQLLVGDVCTREILYAYPHESIAQVLKRMLTRDLYLLPVVSADNAQQVLGIIDKPLVSLASDLNLMTSAMMNLNNNQ